MYGQSDNYDFSRCLNQGVAGCVNEAPLLYIYISNAIWALVVGVIGFGLLWHRTFVRKFRIFDFNSPIPFIIRPKPIESMLLFGSISNFLDALHCIVTITNPDALELVAEEVPKVFLAHLPWQFGICSFSCYLFGIAHTVCNSNQLVGKNWYRMSLRIDIICTVFIILPFITTNVCSIAVIASYLQFHIEAGLIFQGVLYYQWMVYWSILAAMIFIAGLRLIKILKEHLRNQIEAGNETHVQKIKNGLLKVRMTMAISISSMLLFIFIRYSYDLMREQLENNYGVTLGFTIVILYHRTLATTLVVMTVLLNPTALGAFIMMSSNKENSPETKFDSAANKSNITVPTDEVTLLASNIEKGKDSHDLHRQSIDALSQDQKTAMAPLQIV
ncbi:hypothetical protein BD408DRAFT_443572 [Parasitella parasitica]|nr:hypothetical protein BD408DRAFT_443572 [Parasitella parasitica]